MAKQPRKIPEIPVNEPSPISGRIAWHFENVLVRFFKRVFNVVSDPIRSLLAYGLEEFIDLLESQLSSYINPIIGDIMDLEHLPPNIKNLLNKTKQSEHAGDLATYIAILLAIITSVGRYYLEPYGRVIEYATENKVQSHRPSPIDVMLMHRLNVINLEERNNSLNDIGVADRYKNGYQALTENLLDDTTIVNAWLRGLMGDLDINEFLRKKGYQPFSIDVIKKMSQLIPGPQDLIRMAVREAWNDNAASRFGYDEDFPAEIDEWASKIGLDNYWTKKFWRAHWELPGVREGFDMLHRRIISQNELELLLRVKDIPSFWRQSLIKLSYNPFTRVDIRRMYSAGVVTQKEVYENYLDLGYDEDRAKLITDWTVQEYGESSRDLTKGDVIGAYEDSTINLEETKAMLLDLGYDESEISILLARSDLRKQQVYEKEFVENVRLAYVSNEITENDVISELQKLDPPTGFIDDKLSIWQLQKERQVKKPAKSDIKAFLLAGIISEEEAIIELLREGYRGYVVEWFIQLWLGASE